MKYVKISSKSVASASTMFTLGVSCSRGDSTKIGQFGTGSLHGVLCWMRNYGDSPIFMLNGKKVTFTTTPVEKDNGEFFDSVIMKEGRKKTTFGIALQHGELDWGCPSMAIREWVSNALDWGNDIKNVISIVDSIESSDNEVAVFIPYTNIARDYADNIGQYFLHFSGKENERMIEKSGLSKCRLYRKGVFLRELEDDSMFDYNLDFSINECRTGSSDSMTSDIEEQICYYCPAEHMPTIFNGVLAFTKCIETRINRSYLSLSSGWIDFLKNRKIRICMPNIKEENAMPVASEWYSKLSKACPEMDALDKAETARVRGFKNVPIPQVAMSNLNKICSAIESFGLTNKRSRPTLECYATQDGAKPDCLGYCEIKKGVVAIWVEQANSLRTLVHEVCHHYSQATDYSSQFQDYAHNLIAMIID